MLQNIRLLLLDHTVWLTGVRDMDSDFFFFRVYLSFKDLYYHQRSSRGKNLSSISLKCIFPKVNPVAIKMGLEMLPRDWDGPRKDNMRNP